MEELPCEITLWNGGGDDDARGLGSGIVMQSLRYLFTRHWYFWVGEFIIHPWRPSVRYHHHLREGGAVVGSIYPHEDAVLFDCEC